MDNGDIEEPKLEVDGNVGAGEPIIDEIEEPDQNENEGVIEEAVEELTENQERRTGMY